ncbi:MAG: ABC transporter ATP-binding protein [Dehalococcoidia bacterium]
MSTVPLVDIRDVHFSYDSNAVLQGIDLSVQKGEVMGLVGPNGTGKTTLLSIIGGTLRPHRGLVHLAGEETRGLQPRDRARLVATVSQNPVVPRGFTALEMVMLGRNPHLRLLQWEGPEDADVCRKSMELTRTWQFASRPLHSLSGGEMQRVFIARALAQETELLLLDEPTAHLDIGYQPAILDMIEEIRKETNITVIAAMHDLTLAAQYCHRIAVLHQGSVFALGSPSEALRSDVIRIAFGAEVCITEHPVHGTPVILPVSKTTGGPGRSWPEDGGV